MRRGMLFFMAFWAIGSAGLVINEGCGRHRRHPVQPPGGSLALLHPAPGDTVRGEVSLVAGVYTAERVRSLVFLVDGTPVDTAWAPPWEGSWSAWPESTGTAGRFASTGSFACAGAHESAPRGSTLELEAETESGGTETSPAVPVWVLPDASPAVRVVFPGRAFWLERKAGVFLDAEALDPEDGPVPAGQYRWTGTRLGRTLLGARLPIEILPEEEQSLVVTAADRWGRAGSAVVTVRPFTYHPSATAEACIANFTAALQALDPDSLVAQTAGDFVFVPCQEEAREAGWELVWTREIFAEGIHAWMADPTLQMPRLSWADETTFSWKEGATRYSWITLREISLRWKEEPGAGKDDRGAACFLARAGPEERWRVLQWRDLPGETGPSLASLLAAALSRASSGRPSGARRVDTVSECSRRRLIPCPRRGMLAPGDFLGARDAAVGATTKLHSRCALGRDDFVPDDRNASMARPPSGVVPEPSASIERSCP